MKTTRAAAMRLATARGKLYGSDESIKARVYARMSDPDYDPYYDEY